MRWIAWISLLAGMLVSSTAVADRVRVPGTDVRMDPPAGFTPAERFPGFQAADRRASIVVTEIEGPVSEIRDGMTRPNLASRGMTLVEKQVINVDGQEALLLRVTQAARGVRFSKWMLVGGTSERTIMVVGTFPADAADLSGPIRRALMSVSWAGQTKKDLFEGLNFRVDPTTGLRLASRMGNMLVLTESGKLDGGDRSMAVLVVGPSLSDVKIDDLEAFSKERATQTDRLEMIRNIQGTMTRVDSLPGYELTAVGTDPQTHRSVALYQLLLADAGGYYLGQGFVESSRMEDVVPTFRRVMTSFRRTPRVGEVRITR